MRTSVWKTLSRLAAAAAGALALASLGVPATALAGNGCNCTPPPPPPPTPPCNCVPPSGPTINVPGVNVFVSPSVVVNASVNAQVQAGAFGAAGAQTFVAGGGGGGGFVAPSATGLIQRLNVQGAGMKRASYEATRTTVRKVMIEAYCFDDKMVPHPASQVSPDRDIEESYEGELYRCIAGTHMQVTIADWRENLAFNGGATLTCRKGEALWHFPGGEGRAAHIACRTQIPARECNERSLLRRFGAGIKILTLATTEHYTAWREEQSSSAVTGLTLDGGVGGVQY